jgi:hypothetical protein
MMVSRKGRQISIEYLDDKFRNVCCLSFFLLGLLDQERQHSIKWLYELSWIEYDFLEPTLAGRRSLLRLLDWLGTLDFRGRLRFGGTILLFGHHYQYLLMLRIISTLV